MRAALVVAVLVAAAATAHAYPTGAQFDMDSVELDGAGGVAFTGAPRWSGRDCSLCHTDAPGAVGVELGADPYELFEHGYQPGETYRLQVKLVDEWAAVDSTDAGDACGASATPYTPCNDNGFALELADASGQPAGTVAPIGADGRCGSEPAPDADVRVIDGGGAVTHSGFHHARSAWTLCWTAPAAGAGTVTAYMSVVDGGGGDGTEANPQDVTGDDVLTGAVPLLERGAPPPVAEYGGCSAGGAGGVGFALVLGLAALALRGRRRAVALMVLGLALSTTACGHVKPWEREKLAKRKMQFTPDGDEVELDLHMQQSREGSSGGYGSAGGGCGCN